MGARSNGCISCKRRRVKCDETHPSCQRCQKAGITCKGYTSPLIWIDETPRVEHALEISRIQGEDSPVSRKSYPIHHTSNMKTPQNRPAHQSFSVEISPIAFKDVILKSFLVSKLSESRPPCQPQNQAARIEMCWVTEVSSRANKTLDALASIVFGQVHYSKEIIGEARNFYGKGISDLRVDLMDFSKTESFDTLASVTNLCMYELADRRSETAWNHHADGLSRLIEARGPWGFQSHLDKRFFREQRALVVSKAIFSGHGTFLSEQMWKTVPWENNPSSKEPMDYLIDILCDTASHLAEINEPNGMHLWQIFELKRRVVASLEELNCWWKAWLQSNPTPCREVSPDPKDTTTKDASGFVFSTVLQYNDLWTPYSVCTYDATRILLLQILQRISQVEDQASYPPNWNTSHEPSPQEEVNGKTPLLGLSSDIVGLSHEIFRSIEYLNRQAQQYMINMSGLFIFDVAYSALATDSREARWLKISLRVGSVDEKRTAVGAINVLPSCRLT